MSDPSKTTRLHRYWQAHKLPLVLLGIVATISCFGFGGGWMNLPALLLLAVMAWIGTP
jgi:hypothetical protein